MPCKITSIVHTVCGATGVCSVRTTCCPPVQPSTLRTTTPPSSVSGDVYAFPVAPSSWRSFPMSSKRRRNRVSVIGVRWHVSPPCRTLPRCRSSCTSKRGRAGACTTHPARQGLSNGEARYNHKGTRGLCPLWPLIRPLVQGLQMRLGVVSFDPPPLGWTLLPNA